MLRVHSRMSRLQPARYPSAGRSKSSNGSSVSLRRSGDSAIQSTCPRSGSARQLEAENHPLSPIAHGDTERAPKVVEIAGAVSRVPVLAVLAVNRELGLEHLPLVTLGAFLDVPERGADELRFRGLEVLAQLLDQLDEIVLVARRMRGVAAVLCALPPEEPGDFVSAGARVVLLEVLEDLLDVGRVIVVLLAGVPIDGLRLGALVMMIYPYFIAGPVAMLSVAGALALVLVLAVRSGM